MSSFDRAIRIKIRSKQRPSVLAAIRKLGPTAFQLLEEWGLVQNADFALDEFVNRLDSTESIWAFAKQQWVKPTVVSFLVQVLSEAWETYLIEIALEQGPTRLRRAAGLPVSPKEVGRIVKDLRAARARVEKPPLPGLEFLARPELGQELESIACSYEILERALAVRALPERKSGRPPQARTQLEENLEILLGGYLPTTERRRWTARIISEFLGAPTTVADLRRRESARASARKRGGKRG